MKRNILFVGGNGYLGSHLKSFFENDNVVYSSGTKAKNENFYYQIDFNNPSTYQKLVGKNFDIIVILAATINGLAKSDLNNTDLQTNTINFASFLQFIADNRLTSNVVYISSMTVYAVANDLPVKEEHRREPLSIYGLSKKIAEDIADFFARKNEINLLVLRLPGIFGGSRKAGYIYNTICRALKNESVNIDTNGLGYWECIEINDLCSIIKKLIDQYQWESNCFAMNIGYGEKTDFIETARIIIDELKSTSELVIENGTGYREFYMDTTNLHQYYIPQYSYQNSLRNYVRNCKNELCSS